MKALLDTHTLIWALLEPEQLSKRVRSIIENPLNRIYFSSVSMLEIAIKYGLKKLSLAGGSPEDILKEAKAIGFECLELNCFSAATLYLRNFPPGDPFDRIISHLAMGNDLTILSKDPFFKKLKRKEIKHIW